MGNPSSKVAETPGQLNLNQFRLLRVVGKGAFGKVRIVERKDTGLSFALKYIRKDEVIRSESVRNIIRERRMLQHLNHPFLCNLRYSFQDIEYIYLVVDLMTGGDLRFHISRKCFTEEAIGFWVAEMACALRYIHGQNILHRDVKPDNVLLDVDGHVHLADFNVASEFKRTRPLTSKSGTLAYLAPEVYEGKGYLFEVDWWSLGVMFYECIYGKRPFEGRSHDSLSECIRRAQPKYYATNPPVSESCLSAIAGLIEKDRSKRIGSSSWESFISHPFFADLDFEALERREIEPVFRPSSDKTNFDATYDLEELLLEEAPLEARARRQKPRAELKEDATAKEIREDELHRALETMFEPFDYTTVSNERPAATTGDPPNGEDSFPPNGSQGSPKFMPQSTPRSTSPAERSTSRAPLDPVKRVDSNRKVDTNRSTNEESTVSSSGAKTVVPGVSGVPAVPAVPPIAIPSSSTTLPPPLQSPPPTPSPGSTNGSHPATTTSGRQRRPTVSRTSTRKASKAGGGGTTTGDEGITWSSLGADNATSLPPMENGAPKKSGVFSIFRKRRDRSPKPTQRGILGKEGARQIVSG